MEGCAPSMGTNLWGGSPLWEYRLGLVMRARITTSRRQGQVREVLSGGSRSARGARRRTETAYKAEGCEASWHMTAKPTCTQPTVNAALVHRQFAFLPGEICAPWQRGTDGRDGRVVPYPKRPGARSLCPISMRANRHRPIRPRSAPCSDASREAAEVSRGHSSVSVLHESG